MSAPAIERKPALQPIGEHWSYSRIQKYLTCPEQYRQYYVQGLRAKAAAASLVFGSVVHLAIAEYFRRETNPCRTFDKEWQSVRHLHLRYSGKESWESLAARGENLLETFFFFVVRKIESVIAVEQPFQIGVSTLDLPFVGVIDLVAQVDGKKTLVEFKTASSDYDVSDVALSDQLTAYCLAQPDIEQIALCVLVKTLQPRIVWHMTRRPPERALEYLKKVEIVSRQIQQQIFYKRPGKWCRQCEFLPLCLGDGQKAKETLVQIQ